MLVDQINQDRVDMRFLHLFSALLIAVCMVSSASHAASEKKKEGGGKEYVKMQPLMVPVIDSYGVSQVVSLVVSLEVDGVFEADKVKAMSPRLTDAYIQNMYGAMSESSGIKNGVIQVGYIKKRLSKITDEVLGDDLHAEVLIQLVQQRPI